MTTGIDIHENTIQGLKRDLQNPVTFNYAHTLAEVNNPMVHFLHKATMAGFSATNYDTDVLEAVERGIETYEAFVITSGEPVPLALTLAIIAQREKDLNFGVSLSEQITSARERLLDTEHRLALGVHAVCSAYVSPELSATYSVGGAAVVRFAHEEVDQFWQLEKMMRADENE